MEHRGWLRRLARHLTPNLGTIIAVAALLLAFPSIAAPLRAPSAPSACLISYQGRLADTDGNPITGKVNIEFRLYDVPTGGVPLWEEFWTGGNAVDVSDGLFSVMLGSINDTLCSAIEERDELYLGITVGTDSEMEPRVQLGSVPFSVQALTVPDGSITTEKIADGAVTSLKRTIMTYHDQDNSYVTLDGATNITVSEFQFDDVPAGDVSVIMTFVGWHPEGASNRGAVYLIAGGEELDRIPTHIFTTHYGQFALHGKVQNFEGGTLTVRITAGGEISNTKLRFGASNGDRRFGRRITVIAGL